MMKKSLPTESENKYTNALQRQAYLATFLRVLTYSASGIICLMVADYYNNQLDTAEQAETLFNQDYNALNLTFVRQDAAMYYKFQNYCTSYSNETSYCNTDAHNTKQVAHYSSETEAMTTLGEVLIASAVFDLIANSFYLVVSSQKDIAERSIFSFLTTASLLMLAGGIFSACLANGRYNTPYDAACDYFETFCPDYYETGTTGSMHGPVDYCTLNRPDVDDDSTETTQCKAMYHDFLYNDGPGIKGGSNVDYPIYSATVAAAVIGILGGIVLASITAYYAQLLIGQTKIITGNPSSMYQSLVTEEVADPENNTKLVVTA